MLRATRLDTGFVVWKNLYMNQLQTQTIEISKSLSLEIYSSNEEDESFHLAITNPNGFLKTKVNKVAFRTFVQAVKDWDGKNQVVQLGPNGERFRMENDRILSGTKKKHLTIQKDHHYVMLMCPNKETYANLVAFLVANCGK